MPRFPSQAWVDSYVAKLDASVAYRDAGKTWEGDILFVVQKDEGLAKDCYMYLDLFHGQCRKHGYAEEDPSSLPRAEFSYIGPYRNWVRLLKGEIDPIRGLMTGKFKLKGSMMKIMRYSRAAKEMVNATTAVDSDFG
ncbi:MAG TPA: SCP2 sterol-binding domain-containing protein [Thermoplasmata archaeon]|nr:SCP2 sterol-binding domain-containing protein [Thermoplasmata archaeon]